MIQCMSKYSNKTIFGVRKYCFCVIFGCKCRVLVPSKKIFYTTFKIYKIYKILCIYAFTSFEI